MEVVATAMTVKTTISLIKDGTEIGAKFIQEYGSQFSSMFPGLTGGVKNEYKCSKCKNNLFAHKYYVLN